MSQKAKDKFTKHIAIIGGGCAGWSLAAQANKLSAKTISFFIKDETRASHSWGFWQMPWLDNAASHSRKKWHSWEIITETDYVIHQSENHPYCSLKSDEWINWCKQKFHSAKAKTELMLTPVHKTQDNSIITNAGKRHFDAIYDSRPPIAKKDILLQHFKGLEIRVPKPVFNPNTAILMDFRVSQKNGIHFIYVLAYDAYTALVESTFFSSKPHTDETYETAIKIYLKRFYDIDNFEILHSESGIIPMGDTLKQDLNQHLLAIGSNGNAIRPSSGYAFSFIQKQISSFVNRKSTPKTPHKIYDLWMDRVFLAVLQSNPKKAPGLFINLAQALNGDAFARFLSGSAKIGDYIRVIGAMPKWLFIYHAFKVLTGIDKKEQR